MFIEGAGNVFLQLEDVCNVQQHIVHGMLRLAGENEDTAT
jgi:hypothetical protein